MLIFEVISSELPLSEARGTRKYKCTSGPRKGQRVAKISTCSAPISHRSRSYGSDEDSSPRAYVPKDKKKNKKHSKKKLKPHRANIKAESQVNEYGGTGGRNIPSKSKIISTNTQNTTIQNDDNSKTIVPTNDLTKLPDGTIVRNTTKQNGKPDPTKSVRPGDKVISNNANK